MPQRGKGVRLYLRERTGREPVYVIVDGRREIATGFGHGDLEAANAALGEYLAQFRPNTKERNLSKVRVGEVLMLYGQDIAPRKPSAKIIGYNIAALTPFWAEKTLDDVKGSTCRAYVDERTSGGKPVSEASARRELKTLSAAINHWHGESPLIAVPKVTMPPPAPARTRVLSRKEAAAMLRAAHKLKLPHIARFILIGLYTGTRHNAILSLHWLPGLSGGHVDLDRRILYRRGSAERETSKRRPPVQISARLASHLRRWAKADAIKGRTRVIHYQGKAIAKERRAFATCVKAAGLGKDVTPHTLRHTCASWALWEGQTIWDVAGLIGADATTVQRVYGHHRLMRDERKRA